MKFCSKCGNELLDEAVICPKCGCPVAPMPAPQPPEKKRGKGIGIALIVLFGLFTLVLSIAVFASLDSGLFELGTFVMALGSLFCVIAGVGLVKTAKDTQRSRKPVYGFLIAGLVLAFLVGPMIPGSSTAPSNTADSSETHSSTNHSSTDLSGLCAALRGTISERFPNTSQVTSSGNQITVSIWVDGTAELISLMQALGYGADDPDWVELKEKFVYLASTICDTIDAAGYEDVTLELNILNDLNHDNVLLSIYETTVIYDVLE